MEILVYISNITPEVTEAVGKTQDLPSVGEILNFNGTARKTAEDTILAKLGINQN